MLPPASKRMRQENPIDRAGKIGNRRRWTGQAERTVAQRGENIFARERNRARNSCVMAAEGMQTVRVGRGDQGLAIFSRNSGRTPIWIKQEVVKMTELDRIETIDLFEKSGTD